MSTLNTITIEDVAEDNTVNTSTENTETSTENIEENQEETEPQEEAQEESQEVNEDGGRFREFNKHNVELHEGVTALDGLGGGSNFSVEPTSVTAESDDDEVNNIPEVNSFAYDLEEDNPTTTVTGNVLENAVAGDGLMQLQWQNTSGLYGTLEVQEDGSFTYVLDNSLDEVQAIALNQVVQEVFTYSYIDEDGDTATGTLTINITGTNDAPTVEARTESLIEDELTTVSGTINANDIDGDTLTFTEQTNITEYGTFVLNADGTYSYTLNNNSSVVQSLGAGETKTETFTYTVTDDKGATATNTIEITITGTNDIPTAHAHENSITEGTARITGNLPTPDDVDTTDTFSYAISGSRVGDYGTITINEDGSYRYVLNSEKAQVLAEGEQQFETFTYTVDDGNGGTSENTITIEITGTNTLPTVEEYSFSINEDEREIQVGTLPTPVDVDNNSSVTFVEKTYQGTYGELLVKADGTYEYTLYTDNDNVQKLASGETANETFTYEIQDDKGGISYGNVNVTVNGENDAPIGTDAENFVQEDTITTTRGNLPTPQDIDNDSVLNFVPQTDIETPYGYFTLNQNGSYTYTLKNSLDEVQALSKNQTLTDTIYYEVIDEYGATSTAKLDIIISGTNDSPSVSAHYTEIKEDDVSAISGINGTLPEAQDIDSQDTVTFREKTEEPGLYGTLTINADGTYSYTLYDANDERIQQLGEGESLTEKFFYTVVDQHGAIGQNYLVVTINGTNDLLVASPTSTTIKEDSLTSETDYVSSGNISSSITDTDANDIIKFTETTIIGTYGTFTLNENGDYTYTLNKDNYDVIQALAKGEKLSEDFNYTVTDSSGELVESTFTANIVGENDAPTTTDTEGNFTRENDNTIFTGQLSEIKDIDGDTTYYGEIQELVGRYGTLTIDEQGNYTYILNSELYSVQSLGKDEILEENFTYFVYDEHGAYTNANLSIEIKPSTNSGSGDGSGDGNEDSTSELTLDIIRNEITEDSGNNIINETIPNATDGAEYTLKGSGLTNYGQLILNKDGSYSFELFNDSTYVQSMDTGDIKTLTFYYTDGSENMGAIVININGQDESTELSTHVINMMEDDITILSGSLNEENANTEYFYTATTFKGEYGTLYLSENGTYTYVLDQYSENVQGLAEGEIATENFEYTLTDSHGNILTGNIQVNVTGEDDIPIANSVQSNIIEDGASTVSGTINYNQIDKNDTITISDFTQEGKYGTLILNPDGTYSYTINNNFADVQELAEGETYQDIFNYTITDENGNSSTASITINIVGTNDAPKISETVFAEVTEDTGLVASGILPNSGDIDSSDTISFVPVENEKTEYGTLFITAGGAYVYTLDSTNPIVQALGEGEILTETLKYYTIDEHGVTQEQSIEITITGTNDSPIMQAHEDSILATTEQITGQIEIEETDTNDILTYEIKNYPDGEGKYGSLTIDENGAYTYVLNTQSSSVLALNEGEILVDTFYITVDDGKGGTTTNKLEIVIDGQNDAPVIQSSVRTINEDTEIITGTLPALTDYDRFDVATYIPQTEVKTTYGTFTLNADGSYTYVLDYASSVIQSLANGESLSDTITVVATDKFGATTESTFTVNINGTNDAPIVSPEFNSINEDTASISGVLTNAYDIDNNDEIEYIPQNITTSYGSFTLNADGSYTYTLDNENSIVQELNEGDFLEETIHFTVKDSFGATTESTLTIKIDGKNDAPRITAVSNELYYDIESDEDDIIQIAGTLGAIEDIDNTQDELSYIEQEEISTLYGTFTLNADGSYTYVLDNTNSTVKNLVAGETLQDRIEIQAQDTNGGVANSYFTIDIQGTNAEAQVSVDPATVSNISTLSLNSDENSLYSDNLENDLINTLMYEGISSEVNSVNSKFFYSQEDSLKINNLEDILTEPEESLSALLGENNLYNGVEKIFSMPHHTNNIDINSLIENELTSADTRAQEEMLKIGG